jgi:hypothetical protein
MKLSRLPIGGKDRAKCNGLTFDAVQSARSRTDYGSGCNELQEREIQTASQSRSDNHELPLVRFGRIYRRCADHNCVSAAATRQTSKLLAEIFTAERSRSTADNRFAHLRLQFVSLSRRGVLVFDQLDGAMEIIQWRKAFETWRAMATIIAAKKQCSGRSQGRRWFEVGSPGSYSQSRDGSPKTAPIARPGQISR